MMRGSIDAENVRNQVLLGDFHTYTHTLTHILCQSLAGYFLQSSLNAIGMILKIDYFLNILYL